MRAFESSPHAVLVLTPRGGHLGYVSTSDPLGWAWTATWADELIANFLVSHADAAEVRSGRVDGGAAGAGGAPAPGAKPRRSGARPPARL